MPMRIVSVTFRIPSAALAAWREKLRICLAQCIDMHGRDLERGTKRNAKVQLWGLLARRLCYDRNNATPTGKWPRVKKIAYEMHLQIFDALRPLYWVTKSKEKKKAWGACTWQKLPVPFQRFLNSEYEDIRHYFIDDDRIDTDAFYSSLQGDHEAT